MKSLQPALRRSAFSHVDRIVPRIAAAFLTAIVLLYLGFVGIGNWAADEYDDFGRLARDGWTEVWLRLRWSPRPVSEPLFLLYGWTVNHLRRPLIVPFLGLLWCMFLAAGLFTCWQIRRTRNREIPPTETGALELLVALALMASFVSGGATWEVFYWPAGTVAYLPTLAATLLLFLQTASGSLASATGRRICGACLLVAAGSSETGATFVLAYAVVQGLRRAAETMKPPERRSRGPVLWWLVPALVAILIVAALQSGRAHTPERPVNHGPATGSRAADIASAAKELPLEALGISIRPHAAPTVNARFISELLLSLGVALCWSRFRDTSRDAAWDVAALSASFLIASFLTIAAAEIHFHAVCCQRHEIVRRCWILMGLAGIAIFTFGPRWTERLRQGSISLLASVLLCAGVIVAWHTRPALREYRIYGAIYRALDQNFRSGFNPDDDPMTFLLLPPGRLIYQEQVAPGIYGRDQQPPLYLEYVLRFFDKQRIVVRSADEWMKHQ